MVKYTLIYNFETGGNSMENDYQKTMPCDPLPQGTIIAQRYRILSVLGAGGFGITYLVDNIRLNRKMALKECFPYGYVYRDIRQGNDVCGWENEEKLKDARISFIKEAQIIAKLEEYQTIVSVRDIITEENKTAYIVMDYVNGRTLRQYIKEQGVIGFKDAVRLFTPLIKDLDSIYRQCGIVHRDISPDNIMVLPNGSIKLLDFGIAKQIDLNRLKLGGTRTCAYEKMGFSPLEQVSYSSADKIGAWTDVYALCATLYFCLTGEIPIRSIERALNDTLFQEKLNRLKFHSLRKGMEIYKDKRFSNMGELLTALEKDCAIIEQKERAINAEEKATQRKVQKHRLQVLRRVLAGILACTLALAFFSHLLKDSSGNQTTAPESSTTPAATDTSNEKDKDNSESHETKPVGESSTSYGAEDNAPESNDSVKSQPRYTYGTEGNFILNQYDQKGNVIRTTSSSVRGLEVQIDSPKYDSDGNVIESKVLATDVFGRVGYVEYFVRSEVDSDFSKKEWLYECRFKSLRFMIETEYDKNRLPQRMTRYEYGESGTSISEITFYEYDESQRLVSELHQARYGVFWTYIFEYDKNGNCIVEKKVNHDNQVISFVQYEYDSKNFRNKMKWYDGSKNLAWWATFEYDKNDNLIHTYKYNQNNRIQYTVTYEYDSAQNLISIINDTSDDINILRFNEKGQCVERKLGSVMWLPSSYVTFEYDKNGARKKNQYFNDDGSIKNSYEYSYDSKGNLILITEFDENGKEMSRTEYENDTYGYASSSKTIDSVTSEVKDSSAFIHYSNGIISKYQSPSGNTDLFDEYGRLIEEQFPSGNRAATYEYNSYFQRIRQNHYSVDVNNKEQLDEWTEYEYDTVFWNNWTKIIYHDSTGAIKWWTEYEYNSAGAMIKESEYNQSGEITEWTEYKHDEEGNSTKIVYDASGNVKDTY